jgi:8-oxo-dGTP pyrophosphatase MutT (NUDIX family)
MWRRNVVAVIFNEEGHVLGCNRKDRKGWQCVQGGVEDNDSELVAAAWREIDEEVGLLEKDHHVEFVAAIPPPNNDPTILRYRFPKYAAPGLQAQGYVGQQQELLLFFAPKESIKFVRLVPTPEHVAAGAKQEFRSVAWLSFEDFIPKTSDFKLHIFTHMHSASWPVIVEFLDKRFGTIARPFQAVPSAPAAKEERSAYAPSSQSEKTKRSRDEGPRKDHQAQS